MIFVKVMKHRVNVEGSQINDSKAENGRYYFVSWVSGKSLGVRSAYFGYGVFNTELGSDINRALNPQEV